MAKQMSNTNTIRIKQSVINTFKRVNIQPWLYYNTVKNVPVTNRFSGETVETTALLKALVQWVYATSNEYENGNYTVRLDDFDRIRYFILDQDSNVYMTCID